MDIIGYAKSHPWTTGAIVIGGGLTFLLVSGAMGGGSGGSSEAGPSDAEIAANAAITAAQIQAQGQAAQAGAALQAAQIGAGVQMNSDKLRAEVDMRSLEIQQALGLANTEKDRQVNLANIAAQRDVAITTSNNETSLAKKQSSNSRNSSIFGSIASIGLAIFSDHRLKENIQFVGRSKDGYGIYTFNYKGSTKVHRGVIAQDVQQYIPEAVSENDNGYLMVNPLMLGSNAYG